MSDWTVAIAGNGEVTKENAEALLDNWLPLEGAGLVFPKLTRKDKILRVIKSWADDENIDYSDDQVNVVDILVEARAGGDEVYLVLAWDDSEASMALLEQALEAEIPVKDLTRALDDLEFEDENVPDPEPADEPASTSTRGKRNNRAKAEPEGDPSDTDESPPWDESQAGAKRAVDDTVASDAPESEDTDDSAVRVEVQGVATVAPNGSHASGSSYTLDIGAIVRQIVQEEIAALGLETDSIGVLTDDDGNYRLAAKGRPRKGERATKITPTEARKLGLI